MGRLERGDEPTSFIDSLALQHDIDFMKTSGSYYGGLMSNMRAIAHSFKTPFSLQSIAMRAGLSAENLLRTISLNNIHFNKAEPGMTDEETQELGKQAQKLANRLSG